MIKSQLRLSRVITSILLASVRARRPLLAAQQALSLDHLGMPRIEFALRLGAHHGVKSRANARAASGEHLKHIVALVNSGPLSANTVAAVHQDFVEVRVDLPGEI
jgi:hypothetical protein